jgi:hypothetical protein
LLLRAVCGGNSAKPSSQPTSLGRQCSICLNFLVSIVDLPQGSSH